MKIGVIGTGYVGLIQAVGLASFGYKVIGIDIDTSKIEKLKQGISPLYEGGLEKVLKTHVNKNLIFSTDYNLLKDTNVIFLCVGTPQDKDGKANLSFLFEAAENLKKVLDKNKEYIIVTKSTVPVGTNRKLKEIFKGFNVKVVSNPEFLREGKALYDFYNPDRIVLGFENEKDEKLKDIFINKIYKPFKEKNVPFVITNLETAELIKYASNAFLATKISFINEIAKLCDKVGANVKKVAEGMGLDPRIGKAFLNAGIGWGGSCFHPEEVLFIDRGNGLECFVFEELFSLDEKENIKILSFDENGFSLKKLKFVTRRYYEDDLITIKLSTGRKIKVTKDHPVIVYEDNNFKIKLAEDVKIGDKVVIPLYGKLGEERNMEINLYEEIQKTSLLKKAYIYAPSFVEDHFEDIKGSLSNKYPYDVKRYKVIRAKDIVNFTDDLNEYKTDTFLFTVRNRANTVPLTIKLDENFARLLGYYLSEGWISKDYSIKEGKTYKRERIGFIFGAHEKEYIEDLKNILRNLGIKYIENRSGNSHSIIVSSKILSYIFKNVLKCGSDAYTKNIPPQIFNAKENIKWEFLKGLFRGDGCITKLNKSRHLCIEYGTVSKKLAQGLIILLQFLGIVPTIKRTFMKKSKVETYIIRINGYEQIKKLGPLFGEKWENYKSILNSYKKQIKPMPYKKKKNFAILKVKNIKKEKYKEFVYSVETENGFLVSSDGILIHNCFPKDVKALIKQFEENNIEPILVKATDIVNEKQLEYFLEKIENYYKNLKGKTFAVLGLAFKPNTDDLRESRGIKLIEKLIEKGAKIKGFDYIEKARENARNYFSLKENLVYGYNVVVLDNLYEAVKDVNGIIITVEDNKFNSEDWEKIGSLVKEKVIFDGKNILDKERIEKLGFKYFGVGV